MIIDLINRRFVPYYFNVGKGQKGYSKAAAHFVHGFDDRFTGMMVPTPPVWIATPDGELIATLDNFLSRRKFYAQLRRLLSENETWNAWSETENAQRMAYRSAEGLTAEQHFEFANLLLEVGALQDAEAAYSLVPLEHELSQGSRIAQARTARTLGRLDDAEDYLKAHPSKTAAYELEHGLMLMNRREFQEARKSFTSAILDFPKSKELGSLHYFAGVTAYRSGQIDWAHFHFGWVMHHLPEDHNYMRCYLAASYDAMPYANPDLGNRDNGTSPGFVSQEIANRVRAKSNADFQRLLPFFENQENWVSGLPVER